MPGREKSREPSLSHRVLLCRLVIREKKETEKGKKEKKKEEEEKCQKQGSWNCGLVNIDVDQSTKLPTKRWGQSFLKIDLSFKIELIHSVKRSGSGKGTHSQSCLGFTFSVSGKSPTVHL